MKLQYAEDVESTSDRILRLIVRYIRIRDDGTDKFESCGKSKLRAHIRKFVKVSKQIRLVLPAFPMKSPSQEKVLGVLPDYGEELALLHLESLCTNIAMVYEHGAYLTLISDGITYEDMLGVPSKVVLAYNEEMRNMCRRLELKHIGFKKVSQMLKELGKEVDPYNVDDVQGNLWSFLPEGFDVDEVLARDENMVRVYRGFIKFLTKDISCMKPKDMSNTQWKKNLERMGKEMIRRGACFSNVISLAFPDNIRLSIHGHNNAGPKYAIKLLGRIDSLKTPWHNVVCFNESGKRALIHHDTVDKAMHEIVVKNGRPWYYQFIHQAKRVIDGETVCWPEGVSVEQLHPFGIMVKASKTIPFNSLPLNYLARLASRMSLIIFRGFLSVSMEEFRNYAAQVGKILPWVFGDVLVVRDDPSMDLNNVLTKEAMPMHFDGNFKLKTDESGNQVPDPPDFQFFYCHHSGDLRDGLTLFSETSEIVKQRPELLNLKCHIFSPANDNFGGVPLEVDLVQQHPYTGDRILRFHEPWPETPGSKETIVSFKDFSEQESKALCEAITSDLYSPEHCFGHRWETGDFLLADNISLMHTRTAFTDANRTLWRIHLNLRVDSNEEGR